jgi:hypothetical protein
MKWPFRGLGAAEETARRVRSAVSILVAMVEDSCWKDEGLFLFLVPGEE